MPRRGVLSWVVAAAACLGLLTGCGGGESTGSASENSSTLVVLESDIPNGLDIDGNASGQVVTAEIISNLYDTEVFYPVKGEEGGFLVPDYRVDQTGFVPWLTTIEQQSPTDWLVTVRDDIVSCDGNAMTADDLYWALARAKSATGSSNISWFAGYAMNVWGLEPVLPDASPQDKELVDSEVEQTGPMSIVLRQKTPNVNFPRLWTTFELPIFDTKVVEKHTSESDPWAHEWIESQGAAGSGPYCLSSWQKGSQMTLTANPNYFQGQPEFTTVIVKKIPSNANRVAAIKGGEADIVTDLTPREFDELKGDPNVDVHGFYNTRTTSLIFGFNFAPWNEEKSELLRQAFAYAMPYQEIIDNAYFGEARQWYGQVFSQANGYVPIEKYSTDLEKASELLAEAGFPNGQGLSDAKYADGLSLYYPAERSAIIEPIATAIRTSLGKIGVPITLHPIPIVEFQERQLAKHDMGLAIYDFGSPYGADMSYAYTLFFLTPEAGGPLNTGAYSNKTTDELFLKSLSTVGDERQEVLTEMQEILMEDLPQVPLVEWKHQIAVRKGLKCFVGHPDNGIRFWFVTTGTCKSDLLK